MSNVTNSVTDNIFQLTVDFWHMLLVNDDDDVGFSLVFLYNSAMFCIKNIIFFVFVLFMFNFFIVCVRACVFA